MSHEQDLIEKIKQLPPEERRFVLSENNPTLRAALQEVTMIERNLFIMKTMLLYLEEEKNQLEKIIYQLVQDKKKDVTANEPTKITPSQ